MNQQMISEHLARVGLTTVIAENGKIGVDMVASRTKNGVKQFDLIFMDMHMPVMDGLQAASVILKMNLDVPIVALTANVMSNDIEIYRQSGMNDYVSKPFTSQELWRCLMKYFKPVKWDDVNEAQYNQSEDNLRQKLIINFVKSNNTVFDEIKAAISKGDTVLAHRLAHTLKSNAAQIGKSVLQRAAEEVERQLQNGVSPNPLQMSALETELSAVLAELAPLFKQFSRNDDTSSLQPLAPQAMQDLLKKAEHLLDNSDPESLKLTGSLRRIPGSKKLIEQIEDLDFDAALKTLFELKSSM